MATETPPIDPVEYEAWLQQALKPEKAAEFLNMELSELARLRTLGEGPFFKRYGHRSIRYVRRELIAWRDEHTFKSTAEYKTAAQEPEAAPGTSEPPAGAS